MVTVPPALVIGLLCMVPALLLGIALRRIAPRTVRWMMWTFAVLAALLLLVPRLSLLAALPLLLFWVFLYLMRREESRADLAWRSAQAFSPVPDPPASILDTLGRDRQWSAYSGALTLADGRTVPFLYWSGLASTMVTLNAPRGSAHQSRMSHRVAAVSFIADDGAEAFIREAEDLGPQLTARLPDGQYVASWSTGTIPRLRGLLDRYRRNATANTP